MTFTLAVASGPEASSSLHNALREGVEHGEVAWAEHVGMAIAWSSHSPWVTVHDDGQVLVVVDGRLHNLSRDGRTPASLLLARYRERGGDVAGGLLGDFVVVVLDRNRRSLLVARDPVGVRPWYESGSAARHAGASEVATLCSIPWVDDAVDEDEAVAYLAGAAESRGPTLHRGICTLPPGHTRRLGAGQYTVTRHHYWNVVPDVHTTWDDAVERCRELLDTAVQSRLAVAGSPASELSGGLDSSSVVGTAVRLGYDDLLTSRLVFDSARADERQYSDAVLAKWGLRAVSVSPWIMTSQESQEMTAALHRPPPDPNFTMFVSGHRAMLAEGRPDTLTGLGGDDAFVAMSLPSRTVSAVQLRQRSVLGPLLREGVRRPQETWRGVVRPALRSILPRQQPPPGHVASSFRGHEALLARANRRPVRVTGVAAIDGRLDNMTSGYHASILEDAAVVADLVQRRSSHPFMDPRVLEATYGLDPSWPVRGGHDRALQVAAYADRLPDLVLNRRSKAEFSEVVWPSLSDDAIGRVTSGPIIERGWLDPVGFQNVIQHARGGRPWAALPLYRALALDRWLRGLEQ